MVYAGYGALGNDAAALTEPDNYILDLGVGFQTAFRIRDYQLFLSALAAQAQQDDNDIRFRFSFKSYH